MSETKPFFSLKLVQVGTRGKNPINGAHADTTTTEIQPTRRMRRSFDVQRVECLMSTEQSFEVQALGEAKLDLSPWQMRIVLFADPFKVR